MIGISLRGKLSWQAVVILLVGLSTRIFLGAVQAIRGLHGAIGPLNYLYGVGWFSDFNIYYIAQVHSLLAGKIPYLGFGYWSMPGFVYLLSAGFLLGGYLGAGAIIFLSDGLTGVVIYKIARQHAKSDRTALAAALIYLMLPIVMVSEGYLWLDMQPMLLFMMLSVYYLYTDRPLLSGLLMGVAVLMKQEALAVLLVALLYMAASYNWAELKKFTLGSFSLIGIVAVPFLIIAQGNFIDAITFLSFLPAAPIVTPIQQSSNFTTFNALCSVGINGGIMGASGPASCLSKIPNLGMLQFETIISLVYAPIAMALVVFVGSLLVFFSKKYAIPLGITSSYVIISVLALMTFHNLYGYYLVPVYALLLASVYDRADLLILTPLLVLSTFLGPSDLLFITLLTFVALIVRRISLKTHV